jgi:RNA polymerase sigma-70 factor (ECF subfamily)
MSAVQDSSTTRPAAGELESRFEAHRSELTAYCYRMLASPFEAEDAVQDTFIRAWRSYDRFEGRAALRSWLYRIATNVCLDMLSGRERRARPMDLGPAHEPVIENLNVLPETTWIQPIPDGLVALESDPADVAVGRETIRLAFVAALQHLPPRQRAVLILCEVLRWKASEVAELLETSVASVNSALQRARATLDAAPERAVGGALPGSRAERDVLARFADAFESGDIDAVVALLTDDAWIRMPPEPHEYQGREAIGEFLRTRSLWTHGRGIRLVPTRANGQPAFAYYLGDPQAGVARAAGLFVLAFDGGAISTITRCGDNGVLPYFGLPRTIPG